MGERMYCKSNTCWVWGERTRIQQSTNASGHNSSRDAARSGVQCHNVDLPPVQHTKDRPMASLRLSIFPHDCRGAVVFTESSKICAVPDSCPTTPTAGSARSERYCRCRFFLLTVQRLPSLPQVLRTAVAVNNMSELISPLCREVMVRDQLTHSTRGDLDLASDT